MKIKLFVLFFCFASLHAIAQPVWQWAKSGGGTGATNNYDIVYGIAKDASNNIYSCGTFHGTNVPIGSGTYSSTLRAAFITKKDLNGNPIWQYLPTSSNVSQAFNITIDENGDVLVCGQYSGTITFGSTSLTAGTGSNSVYVAKLNGTTGLPIWANAFKSAGDATSDIIATGITTHSDGSIYFSGNFKGTNLTFNSTTTFASTMNGAGALQLDGYVVKLNSSGVTQWVRRVIGPTGSNNSDKIIYDIAVDANGNPTGVGSFRSGSAIMYPGNVSVGNTNGTMGAYDGFLVAWQPDGTNIGISKYGSVTGVQNDYLYGIELMPDNNFAICGAFNNVAHLKKINATTQAVISSFQPSNGNGSSLYVLDSDNDGNLYAAGIITNPATFGSTTLTPTSSIQDGLLVKINSSNTWDWAQNFGSISTTLTNDLGRSIVALGNNDVVVGGAFSANMALGSIFLAAAGNGDFFEARYAPCSTTLSVTTQPTSQTVCQSAAGSFSATFSSSATYQWYKNGNMINGASSSTYNFTATYSDNGATYYCTATGPCGTVTTNTVTLTVSQYPTFTVQPVGGAYCTGDALNLSVTASNANSYQWKVGGNAINGATNSTYTLSPIATNNAGNYSVTATNSCGSTNSNYAIITINSVPTLTTQPSSYSQCLDAAYTFSVGATGGADTYQWYKDAQLLVAQNTANLYIQPISNNDAGTYYCVVANNCGSITSNNATLTVINPPAITIQPVSQSVCSGYTTTFSITATGSSLSYQWKKDGIDVQGATSSVCTINNTSNSNAGSYTCVVSGSCGSAVTSNAAVLIVNSGVTIATQPQSQSICSGSALSLSVIASGTGLSYQWKKDNVNISNATSSTYSISSTSTINTGSYTVDVISSQCGTLSSNAAIITILDPVSITTHPANNTVCAGTNTQLTISATGSNLTYQWKKDGVNINGATSSTLVYPTVSTANAGSYTCVVSGSCGSAVTSNAAVLTVNSGVTIATQPQSQSICSGSALSLSVIASGTGISYQWKKDNVNISNATSSTYSISSTSTINTGSYTVDVISSQCGTLSSNAAIITILDPVSITTHPTSNTVCAGTNTQLTISATGSNLVYQWKKDGVNINGATSSTLVYPIVSTANAGSYTCVVSGTCNNVTSNSALLNVNALTSINSTLSNQTVCEGVAYTQSPIVNGANLSYQWYKDNAPISTSASLSIPSTTISDQGSYTLTVTGSCGTATSNAAVLSVNSTTQITQQPVSSLTMCEAESNQLSVVASGTNLTYQWKKDNVNIVGATNSILNLENVTTAATGNFAVEISGACGVITSNSSSVLVNELTEIVGLSNSQDVCQGETINLNVNAVGSNLLYQWSLNGNEINGATNSSLLISNSTSNNNGKYTVEVVGVCGIYTSDSVQITINIPSSSSLTQTACSAITLNGETFTQSGTYTQVISNAVGCDSTITLNLTINSIDTSIVVNGTTLTANQTGSSYQWINCATGLAIPGETSQQFVATQDGEYAVVVSNGYCSDTSNCFAVAMMGINSISTNLFKSIHPNPTTGNVIIQLGTKTSIQIENILGERLMHFSNHDHYNIDLGSFENGIYIIRILDNQETFKIVKQ